MPTVDSTPKFVLVAVSDPGRAEELTKAFKQAGFSIQRAINYSQADEFAHKMDLLAVVLDETFTEPFVLKTLREYLNGKQVPVVFLTTRLRGLAYSLPLDYPAGFVIQEVRRVTRT